MTISYLKTKEVLFKEDAISYYILGAFMTDGSVRFKNPTTKLATECELGSKDADWLLELNSLLGNEAKVLKKSVGARIRFWDKEIFDWFVAKGCTPNKSITLQFPKVPKIYLPDFLRGCIDGDGSISLVDYKKTKNGKVYWYKKINTYLCGSSPDFMKSFSDLLTVENIPHSFVNKFNKPEHAIQYKHPHFRVHMNDSRAKKFLAWIYYNNNPIAMPRKQNLANKISLL